MLPTSPPKNYKISSAFSYNFILALTFSRFIEQFLDRMKMYQGYADDFAEMSQPQISQVWDSAAAVDMAIIAFSKEVKALQAENENGGYDNEN